MRILSYDQGALYFATVNAAARKASHGKRSLDDLPRGLNDFRSMLPGKQIRPAADAFGPCFRRTTKPLRRYELGFDPKVTAQPHRVVRGLLPGSPAARAGLKDGDEILTPFGQDSVQEDQTKTITLEISRNGKTQSITYLPRGVTGRIGGIRNPLPLIGLDGDTERSDLAAQLSKRFGLPINTIDRKQLVISPRQFRTTSLSDRHQEAYLFDLRRTAAPDEPPPTVFLNYWRGDLKYVIDLPDLGIEPIEVGYNCVGSPRRVDQQTLELCDQQLSKSQIDAAIATAVDSGRGPLQLGPPPPASAQAVGLNPRMRILAAGGLYDSYLPCAAGAEAELHLSGALRTAMSFHCYVGGHAMYLDAQAPQALSTDVRALISRRH